MACRSLAAAELCESHKQNPEMVAEMDRLVEDYNYADTARILNERVSRRATACRSHQ